jgi:uncharacterized protein YbjQ (UPF0145 family)
MKLTVAALIAALLALPLLFLTAPAAAADDAVADYNVANVIARAEYAQEFQGFHIYFGDAPHPAARTVERNATTSLRTRKFGRSNEESCQWVLISALVQLRDHARSVGGDGVANVRSNWRNNETSSRTTYKCAAGFLMAGVALKADVVDIR